jgi:hypothetical protein
LRNAAWIVDGSTIDGSAISGCASRAVCTASRIDSVPPDVTEPTVVGGPSRRSAAIPTSSFSICSRLGNAVGSSPLLLANAAIAVRPISSASSSPLSYT